MSGCSYQAAAWVFERGWDEPKRVRPGNREAGQAGPQLDPRAYSPEQLDLIEAALRLLLNRPKPQAGSEVIPPDRVLDSSNPWLSTRRLCRLGRRSIGR